MSNDPTPSAGLGEESPRPAKPPALPEAGPPPGPNADKKDEPIADLFLREAGEVKQDVLEIAARDVERSLHHEARLAREKAEKRESFYSDLVFTLTNLRYEEQEARVLWVNLLTHKMDMSDRLGRNVGIRVAALDYFKNILGALDNVKIIDASAFLETAQLAVTDGLTGVFNHRYFQDRLIRDVNRAKEEGGYVTLLMIDIDNFKQYNDINGHIAGDVALKEVAAVLRRNLKREDLVARYGGEEFAVILVGLNRHSAFAVADRIRSVVAGMEFPNMQVLPGGHLTISIGLAEFPGDADERGALIGAADRALYVAKRSGKNRVGLVPSDQRGERRFPLNTAVSYRLFNRQNEEPLAAQAENLSYTGLCMVTPGALVEGQLLNVCFTSLSDERPILGRVVWKIPKSNGQIRVGIKFINIKPEDFEKIRTLAGV